VVLKFSFSHTCVPIVTVLYVLPSASVGAVEVGAASSFLQELNKKIDCIKKINTEHFSAFFIKNLIKVNFIRLVDF
jgi:hypothetical protein